MHGSRRGTSRCFSVNTKKNVFQCFKCGNHGNALDLWTRATNQSIYDAAIDIARRMGIELPVNEHCKEQRKEEPVSIPWLQAVTKLASIDNSTGAELKFN